MDPHKTLTLLILCALVLAFATLTTAHVLLAAGIARRRPWWRGALALVVFPLAPWWGWREGMRGRSSVWIGAALVYGVSLGLSFAG